ncbi:hypothetical protein MKP08_07790 [Erythrobacter sp. LQ02-29]|uniref:hypothetical protein n=1 Tax=Erythrobacter sp. LQ02-29 TaxID=2920384 RepID=UPI001F4D7111|nr:hypothetical protein [Erythrobacter sp. LQ02-29]MCP9222645.1 hypothetical protein [Erythrobacter sp. LQ02-29]
MELVQANWPWLLAALLIGLAVAWLIFAGNRKTRIAPDDDGADTEGGGAKRNQALIDAPPAASAGGSPANPPIPPVTPMGVAGAGTAVAAAVEADQIAREEEANSEEPAAPPPAAPAPVSTPPSAHVTAPPPAPAQQDDLTRIKGLGPKLSAQLHEMGITTLSEIANWSDADVARIDAQLGRFAGRIERDDWREQARLLGEGDMAAYEDRFGKL